MPGDEPGGPIYDIAVERLPFYAGRKVIVRARSATAVVVGCQLSRGTEVLGVQLQGLPSDVAVLTTWREGVPIELSLLDPATQFPSLYRFAGLVDTHPLRVLLPVWPGFSRAVKLAVALHVAVRLDVGQPDPSAVEELAAALEFYLYESCTQPIEFFHGALGALYHGGTTTLWDVLDENPALIRHVDDAGAETLRRGAASRHAELGGFVPRFRRALLAERAECVTCEFWQTCGGYFKWPRRDYDCRDVKRLFRALAGAATELRQDVERLGAASPESPA